MNFKFNINEIKTMCSHLNLNYEYNWSVTTVSSINNPKSNSIMFIKNIINNDQMNKLKKIKECIIFVSKKIHIPYDEISSANIVIFVNNAKCEWGILLKNIIDKQESKKNFRTLKNGAIIGINSSIGNNVKIEHGVFIDNNVEVEDNCIIKTGTKIKENVKIGKNVVIHENCVIGSDCFAKELDNIDGTFIHIPHIGGVEIGDNSSIHSLTYIGSGLIDPTKIGNNVHVAASVVIAHNTKIGNDVLICGNNMICGSVTIGSKVWIGAGAIIANHVVVGDNVIIGLGSCVHKDILRDKFVLGSPARVIPNINRKKFNPFNL